MFVIPNKANICRNLIYLIVAIDVHYISV